MSHDRLWAPWRMGYVVGEKGSGCFLCKTPAEKQDEANLLLRRGRECFVVLNRYPYNNGHLLISPYRHVAELVELTDSELLEMGQLAREWSGILKARLNAEGFNLGLNAGKVAGAGVADHLHLHLVPRWDGDSNFMSVVTDTRVLVQSLEEAYWLLRGEGG